MELVGEVRVVELTMTAELAVAVGGSWLGVTGTWLAVVGSAWL